MPKLFQIAIAGVLLCSLGGASAQVVPQLGRLQVLSSPAAAPEFEIALASALPAQTSIQLASPQAHEAKGYAYPLWLSDAAFEIKDRATQRQSIRVLAKRAHPRASSEIVLEFASVDGKQLVPYTLLLEQPSQFDGRPNPPMPVRSEIQAQPAQAAANSTASVVAMHVAPISPAQTVSNTPPAKKPKSMAMRSAAVPNTLNVPAIVTSDTPIVPATNASSAVAPNAPALVASAPILPQPAPRSTAYQPTQPATDWLVWALGGVSVVLVLLLAFKMRQRKREQNALHAPILTQETQFGRAPNESSANTVFGLSDTEAIDLQKQWLEQKQTTFQKK